MTYLATMTTSWACMASNFTIISEIWIGKDKETAVAWWMVLTLQYVQELNETTKSFEIPSSYWRLNSRIDLGSFVRLILWVMKMFILTIKLKLAHELFCWSRMWTAIRSNPIGIKIALLAVVNILESIMIIIGITCRLHMQFTFIIIYILFIYSF
jgi:hypothetical protein